MPGPSLGICIYAKQAKRYLPCFPCRYMKLLGPHVTRQCFPTDFSISPQYPSHLQGLMVWHPPYPYSHPQRENHLPLLPATLDLLWFPPMNQALPASGFISCQPLRRMLFLFSQGFLLPSCLGWNVSVTFWMHVSLLVDFLFCLPSWRWELKKTRIFSPFLTFTASEREVCG